ncbi:MAG: hypothetical protein OXD01_04880 [Gammaproteobacteria bacterium]|nr:hypothetical protein [Gammaproteobacteria bacterium]
MSPSAKPNWKTCVFNSTERLSDMRLLLLLSCLDLVLVCNARAVEAQQDQSSQTETDASYDPDAEFSFDDDIFAVAFDEESTAEKSWFDDFTIRISQQISGQVNSHRIDFGALGSLSKPTTVENNRVQINIRYQNAFAPGWLLQGTGWYRLYWDQDYMAGNTEIDSHTESQINDLFLQYSSGAHSFRFGNQTVVWGEMIGNSVLDVINHIEFRDFTIIDIEDARLNQPMLIWDYYGSDNSSFSSFINLYPEFNPAPVRGSPLFFDTGINLPDYNRSGKVLLEAGTQWKKSFAGSDIGLMVAYLYENQLRYDPPDSGSVDARPAINDFLLLGFSANRAIGRLLLNFDLAFSHNILANSFAFPGTSTLAAPVNLRKDQIGTSFGLEYSIDNEQDLSVGIQAQKILDPDAGLPTGQTLVSDEIFGNWLIRYSNNLRNGDLLFSTTLQGDLEGDSFFAALGLDYTLNDNWSLSSQIISITASAPSPLVIFDQDLRIGATLTFSF